MTDDDDGTAISYTLLARGTPVRGSDLVEVGTVREVLDNPREHIFDGIVLDTPAGRRFVDAPEVGRIAERWVTLTITAAEAAELPPPDATPGTPVETSLGPGGGPLRALRDRWRRR